MLDLLDGNTLCVSRATHVEIVQRVLGHGDIRSTLNYADRQEAQVRAELEFVPPRRSANLRA
jgi:hypothetical protein